MGFKISPRNVQNFILNVILVGEKYCQLLAKWKCLNQHFLGVRALAGGRNIYLKDNQHCKDQQRTCQKYI
jgi:hypothetical protein